MSLVGAKKKAFEETAKAGMSPPVIEPASEAALLQPHDAPPARLRSSSAAKDPVLNAIPGGIVPARVESLKRKSVIEGTPTDAASSVAAATTEGAIIPVNPGFVVDQVDKIETGRDRASSAATSSSSSSASRRTISVDLTKRRGSVKVRKGEH